MNLLRAKKYLYQIREEKKEIDELRERIMSVEASMYPSGIRYDLEKVQKIQSNGAAERLTALIDYRDQLMRKEAHLERRRIEAQRWIDTLDKSMERQILDLYFLSERRMRMEDVADLIGMEPRQTYRIYHDALRHLDEGCQ